MGFYYTSANVKMMRNIILDFEANEDMTPYEYMEVYIEKCPDDIDNLKLQWISETFLGLYKHWEFLRKISAHMSNELSQEEQDYFMIYFHALTFQISPKDLNALYKSLFNLNKIVLGLFAQFLANNESLTFITQIAEQSYDTTYITEKIITPIFHWQPYVSEMEHNYEEYVSKVESRKIKPLTVPIAPNLYKRLNESPPVPYITPAPPNSIKPNRKMLTKSVIDQKLNHIRHCNKEKATRLLKEVKSKNYHFAQGKSERYFKKLQSIQDEYVVSARTFIKPKTVNVEPATVPADTIASIKRISNRIQVSEENEIKWLQDVLVNCHNHANYEELLERERIDREKEKLIDMERKHLLGQLSYEEAVLAKKNLQDENKKKYKEFLREREIWNIEIENWKKTEIERLCKQVEKHSLHELAVIQAKAGMSLKKKDVANKVKKENQMLSVKILKDKKEELERKINMIKEIKILSLIAKKTKIPKIIDLTQTSRLGLLCEMSIAELQERLNILKFDLKEEVELKKKQIRDEYIENKKTLEVTKESINNYMTERAQLRKINKERMKCLSSIKETVPKELNDLKRALIEKRKQRISLTN